MDEVLLSATCSGGAFLKKRVFWRCVLSINTILRLLVLKKWIDSKFSMAEKLKIGKKVTKYE
jgi:hypothetical protein